MSDITVQDLVDAGLARDEATTLVDEVARCLSLSSATERWNDISRRLLLPAHPFAVHKMLFAAAFADWSPELGPPPAWFPSEAEIQSTHLYELMVELGVQSYQELHAWSARNRIAFWEKMIARLQISFDTPPTAVGDPQTCGETSDWLPEARLNIANSCFNTPGNRTAIIFQPEGGDIDRISYGQLQVMSNRVAQGLVRRGIVPGASVAIYMPMTVEAVAIYLGIVKAGAVVVSIADSFVPQEISTRLRIAPAQLVFTQDRIVRGSREFPLYPKVVEAGGGATVVVPWVPEQPSCTLRKQDLWWSDFLAESSSFDAVARCPADPTNILFSSGTTGEPKAIPWTQTTPIKCAADGYLHQDIHPGEVVAWPTNLGWMMGPWLIYAALINSASIGLYYGAPTQREFGQFIAETGVNMLGVVPSTVRAWRGSDCLNGLDWSKIRCFSSTGECSDPDGMLYLMSRAGYKPVIEYCGGTEIGGGYITGTMVQPAAPATFSTAALGLDIAIADDEGKKVKNGELFIEPPSIGLSNELLNGDHHATYFSGVPKSETGLELRRHGDRMEKLANGYYRAHGRTDDTMNLSGIKVSSVEIEHAVSGINGVFETAAVAIQPPYGGPCLLVVYAVVAEPIEKLREQMQAALKENLNPLFRLHDVVTVDNLPRTASNKVMRRVLRDQYQENLVR